MCGRFVIQATWAEYRDYLTGFVPESAVGRNDPARYNVAPTQDVPFIVNSENGAEVKDGRWAYVPPLDKKLPKWPMINAKSESVTPGNKWPWFGALGRSRCLIPASGYYEWTKADDKGKDPWAIHLPDWEPWAFAGLWAYNETLNITSCTIITAATPDGIEISDLHNRIPVILKPDQYETWMDPDTDLEGAAEALNHHRAAELTAYRVSRTVNKNTAKGPELIEPV